MIKREEIIKKLKAALNRDRFKHSLRVEKAAVYLAQQHGVAVKKASIAALLHDYGRQFPRNQLLKQAQKHKIKTGSLEKAEPKLVHAKLSALLAKKDFKITDPDILSAINKHTLGSPRMTKLEKIIYLADHLEEGRSYPEAKKIRQLAQHKLDQAVALAAAQAILYLLRMNVPIHPGTILTMNYYLLKS
ncbi:MAG: bis(5'-nucleosyl)-tetraphosphatase (symmetrical) YqeK [bacterium]